MPIKSTTKAKREAQAKQLFEDGHGVRFGELRTILPPDTRYWDSVRPVLLSESCCIMHNLFSHCFLCLIGQGQGYIAGSTQNLEAHHIIGGCKKSDELCNLVILCRECHTNVQSVPAELPRVLRAKWKHDREHTDWRRLTLLNRHWWDFDSLD